MKECPIRPEMIVNALKEKEQKKRGKTGRERVSEPVKCPVCGKKAKTGSAIDCAKHIFGIGDKPHRAWVEAQGLSFIDLLIQQVATPGNKSDVTLAEFIEKAQGKI
jgi:hypothetical protein